jgi:hypothetical protein
MSAFTVQEDCSLKVKAGKKLGEEPIVAMCQLPELGIIVCLIASGKISILDLKLNVKDPKDIMLPDGLRPHGLYVKDSKTLYVPCSKGTLVQMAFSDYGSVKPEFK